MDKMQKVFKNLSDARIKAGEKDGTRVGYYLVHSSGRYFISSYVSVDALEAMCDRVLTDTDYDYWIDYSNGNDIITGGAAWSNVDFTDSFI